MRAILFSICALFGLVPRPVEACTCSASTVEEGLETSEYVFFAFVHRAEAEQSGRGKWLRLSLSQVVPFKGGKPPFATLRTPLRPGACGMQATVPEYYWFFTDSNGTFTSCSPTSPAIAPTVRPLTAKIVKEIERVRREAAEASPARD